MEVQALKLFTANTTIMENVSYESDRDKTVLNILKHYHELKPEISGFGFYFSAKISHPKIKLCHFQP